MKKKYKRVAGLVLAVLAVAGILLWNLRPISRETQTVDLGPLTDDISEQGRVVPRESQVILAPLAGVVVRAPAVGDRIEADSPVVEIDDENVRLDIRDQIDSLKLQQTAVVSDEGIKREQLTMQLEESRQQYSRLYLSGSAASRLETAQEAYRQASREYENGAALAAGGFLAEVDLQKLYLSAMSARQELLTAQSEASPGTRSYYEGLIKSYETQLAYLDQGEDGRKAGQAGAAQLAISIETLERKLDQAKTGRPYAVTVWEVTVQQGQYVQENQPLAAVYQDGEVEIEAWLLAEETAGLSPGMEVLLETQDGQSFSGELTTVSPVAKEMASSVGLMENRCRITVSADGLPDGVGAGFPVDVTVSRLLAEKVLSVPLSALVPSGEGEGVYVVKGRKKELREVETGRKGNGRIEILTGLEEGEAVWNNPVS